MAGRRELIETICRDWWRGLTDAGNAGRRADRGALARLRRVGLADFGGGPEPDLTALLGEEAFRSLYRRLRGLKGKPADWETDLVTVAMTLAHVREDAGKARTAALLGGPDDDKRRMKEARFRRLMRVADAGDLFDEARRLIMLLDRRAPVGELGASLLLWRHEPHVRRDWARAYYGLDTDSLETTDADIAQAGA